VGGFITGSLEGGGGGNSGTASAGRSEGAELTDVEEAEEGGRGPTWKEKAEEQSGRREEDVED
jgi:hypothetical protein